MQKCGILTKKSFQFLEASTPNPQQGLPLDQGGIAQNPEMSTPNAIKKAIKKFSAWPSSVQKNLK